MGDYFETDEDEGMDAIRATDVNGFDAWLAKLAELLHAPGGPESLLGLHLDVKDLLFDTGASPSEAADFLRMNLW